MTAERVIIGCAAIASWVIYEGITLVVDPWLAIVLMLVFGALWLK